MKDQTVETLEDYLLGRTRKVRFSELCAAIEKLGWNSKPIIHNNGCMDLKCLLFTHPKTDLFILLRKRSPQHFVGPFDLLSVRNTLGNAGFWKRWK